MFAKNCNLHARSRNTIQGREAYVEALISDVEINVSQMHHTIRSTSMGTQGSTQVKW